MPTESDAELRAELETAIARVRHQIEVQSTADHYIGSEGITRRALEELRDELAGLEAAAARLP